MAIHGTGQERDYNLDLSAGLKTTTSQYLVVELGVTDYVANLPTNTVAADHAYGVLQSYQSSGSVTGRVRVAGLTKVKCVSTITAGDLVKCTASVTNWAGYVESITLTAGTTTNNTITNYFTLLGRAMEAGVTNQVITIDLNKQILPNDCAMWKRT